MKNRFCTLYKVFWLSAVISCAFLSGCGKNDAGETGAVSHVENNAAVSAAEQPVSDISSAETVVSSGSEQDSQAAEPGEIVLSDGWEEHADGSVTGLVLSAGGDADIYYTTDGTVPTTASLRYEQPLSLHAEPPYLARKDVFAQTVIDIYTIATEGFPQGIVLKAAAITPDGVSGPVLTRTFFPGIDLEEVFPGATVISAAIDPADLLDYENGIMSKGRIYDEWAPTEEGQEILKEQKWWLIEANYSQKGKDWERPAHIEIFENGSRSAAVSEACGLRLQGTMSRQFGQKSFSFYFRDSYGTKTLEHELIENAVRESDGGTVSRYRTFMLRNGGNANGRMIYRDALQQTLAKMAGLVLSYQESQPAVLFLNGEYWGVYLLQEKYSDHYFEEHYGVDKDDVVVIKEGEVDEGEDEDIALYEELMEFAEADLSDPAQWERFQAQVDTDSLADYIAVEWFVANWDWEEDSNISMWRVREPGDSSEYEDGRWRFQLYDTDYSSNLYSRENDGPSYNGAADIPEKLPLFAAALCNDAFREQVIGRLEDLTSAMGPEAVRAVFSEYQETFDPLLQMSCARFFPEEDTFEGYEGLKNDEKGFLTFYEKRADFVKDTMIPFIENDPGLPWNAS